MVRCLSLAGLAAAIVVGALSVAPREADAFRRARVATMEVALCVDDPCDCCGPQEVCVCVPCCCTEEPCVTWRNGIFGRRVATYTWRCCGHSVDVVVTRHGELIVRGG